MKTIIVTGGAGFIGSNLIAELLKEGNRVICVDNFDDTYDPKLKRQNISTFLENKNFILKETDICNLSELESVFDEVKPNNVIHLAAKADTRDAVKNPRIYISVNIDGTLNILELCRKFEVESLVIASSGSVYGNNPNIPWKEEENTDQPLSAYGASKKMTELLAYSYNHNFGMNIICLRYFNVYGENNRPNMVPYKWADSLLSGKEIEMSGDGSRKRDFTYVGDVVRGTILAMKAKLGFEVINIGNSNPHSLQELLEVFEKTIGVKALVNRRESHKASVNEMFADSTKAKKLLGWEPEVYLEEGISKLVTWFRGKP